MRAFVIDGPRRGSIQTVSYPEPGPGEVVIQVKRCGICGTDTHIFEGEFLSPYPIIPGHELSGVIDHVGEDVTEFRVGDRVTADPTLPCNRCDRCLTGRMNQCRNWEALGNTVNGAMAEYVKVPAANVVPLPDDMSYQTAAFTEPVACVVHAMNRLSLKSGKSVLLFGAGAMGQQLIQALSRNGAGDLVVVDLSQDKLNLAMQFGATRGILADAADVQLPADYPDGFDVVVDVTGIPKVIQGALKHIGATGTYLQFGVTPMGATITLPTFDLYRNDWTVIGSMAINDTFIPAYNWLRAGRIQTDVLVSRTVTLDELPQWMAEDTAPDVLKAQVTFE